MEDSNDKRPVRAPAVTDIKDEVSGTTSEGTDTNVSGKNNTSPEIEDGLQKANEMSPVHNTVEPSISLMSTDAIPSGKTSSTPKISLAAKEGAALADVFIHSGEQLWWRTMRNNLCVNVMLCKYSLHTNKVKQITEYLDKKSTELDTSDIIPPTEKRQSRPRKDDDKMASSSTKQKLVD